MKKTKKTNVKRYTVVLSETEVRRLTLYAQQCGVQRPVALHRIVAQTLRSLATPDRHCDCNQLGLFDTLQIDIFNNAAPTNNVKPKT